MTLYWFYVYNETFKYIVDAKLVAYFYWEFCWYIE